MTDERVAQIEARLQAATPGKWETYGPELRSIKRDPWPMGESEFVVLSGFEHGINTGCERPRDAEFIAHAPEDLRLVLDDNKALRAEVERLRTCCARADALQEFLHEEEMDRFVARRAAAKRTAQ